MITSGITVVHFSIRCRHFGSSGLLCVYLRTHCQHQQGCEDRLCSQHGGAPLHGASALTTEEARLAPEKRVAEKPLRPGFLCTICTGRSKIMSTRISPSVMRGRKRWLIS